MHMASKPRASSKSSVPPYLRGAVKVPPKPHTPRPESVVTREKHKLVAECIAQGMSEGKAMRIAGYHPSNAGNVMRQEQVQTFLAEARQEVTDLSTIKRLDVLNIFLEAIDMGRMLADPAQMINGADKIAKMMGYYAPETLKLELSTNTSALASKLKALTDNELLEIAAGRAKVIEGESEIIESSASTPQ